MNITNKYDLPQSLVNAVGRFSYSRGKSDISVTQLIDSPRIVKLKEKHSPEIVSDISEEIWRLVGSALHLIDVDFYFRLSDAISAHDIPAMFAMAQTVVVFRDNMIERDRLTRANADSTREKERRSESVAKAIESFQGSIQQALANLRTTADRLELSSTTLNGAADAVTAPTAQTVISHYCFDCFVINQYDLNKQLHH